MPRDRGRRTPSDIAARGRTGGGSAAGAMFPPVPPGQSDVNASLGVAQPPAGGRFGAGQLVLRPPFEFPPSSARFFNANGYASVSNAAANDPAALLVTIPNGSVGVIRGLGLSINNLTTTSDPRWDLIVNGAAVPGFSNLTMFPRTATSVSLFWDSSQISILVPDGASIQLRLRVGALDGSTYQMGGNFVGWSYSKGIAEQFRAAFL